MKEKETGKAQIVLQNLLKEERNLRGISQMKMAERLGFPQSSVSKYEAGERKLDFIELRAVCHALGIPLSDFILKFERKIKEDS